MLLKRTEGWPAALYLAALSLGEAADPNADARRFAGDDRLVVDYLRDEFIANLDPEAASFLIRTSILDELSGDLCDAVLQSEGSASTLRELARSNALVKPLDSKDRAFKYHSLLRDMLAAELHRLHPREEPDLHGRAAGWYAARGDYDSAVPHAIASGDAEAAASLIWSQAATYSSTGRVTTLKRWLSMCDRAQIADSPELCLVRATAATGSGDGADAAHWTARALALLDESPGEDANADQGLRRSDRRHRSSAGGGRRHAQARHGGVRPYAGGEPVALELPPDRRRFAHLTGDPGPRPGSARGRGSPGPRWGSRDQHRRPRPAGAAGARRRRPDRGRAAQQRVDHAAGSQRAGGPADSGPGAGRRRIRRGPAGGARSRGPPHHACRLAALEV